MKEGPETQVWLGVEKDPAALVTGRYFYHKKLRQFHSAAAEEHIQDSFPSECAFIRGAIQT